MILCMVRTASFVQGFLQVGALTPVIILPTWDGGGLPVVPGALNAVAGPTARIPAIPCALLPG